MSLTASGPDLESLPRNRGRETDAWVWKVTALCLLLGLLLALALRTNEQIRERHLPSITHGTPIAALSKEQEKNQQLAKEVDQLRDQVNDFRAHRQSDTHGVDLLKKEILEYRAAVGFAAVRGPGLMVHLRDSPQQDKLPPGTSPSELWVTDTDVTGVVSELRAAGAEAYCISEEHGRNAQRFIATTTVRSAGHGMLVNGKVLRPPYEITAIGSPKDLRAALEMPEGIIMMRAFEPLKMIKVEERAHLLLPAYLPSLPKSDDELAPQS